MKKILFISYLLIFYQSSIYAETYHLDCEGSWTQENKVGWLGRHTKNDSGRVNGKLIISEGGVDYRNNGALVARFYDSDCSVRDNEIFCRVDGCDEKACDTGEFTLDLDRRSFLFKRHIEFNDGGMPGEREDQHEGYCYQ